MGGSSNPLPNGNDIFSFLAFAFPSRLLFLMLCVTWNGIVLENVESIIRVVIPLPYKCNKEMLIDCVAIRVSKMNQSCDVLFLVLLHFMCALVTKVFVSTHVNS